MPRRPVVLALAAITTWTSLASSASAAPGHHRVKPASSVALVASGNATFRVAADVAGAAPRRTSRLATHDNHSVASGIAADGDHALVCADSDRVYPVHSVRTKARIGRPIDVSRFSGEGGKGFAFFCDGLSVRHRFALAAGDSQGVIQLVLDKSGWKVDRRVHSAGTNEAGRRHRPGWIRFGGPATSSTYRTVSIAPRPLPGGGYLAVAVDRADGTLAVIKGAGTPKARNVGVLTSPRLLNPLAAYGTGGLAWQPGASNRALVATARGFAVLDLRHPSRPRLRRLTTVGNGVAPGCLSVSADGDHLAVAAGARVYGYRHVRAAVGHGRRLVLQTSFRLGRKAGEQVADVGYTSGDALAVLHGVVGGAWSLTVVRRVPAGHHAVKGSMPTTSPSASGSLSVWPAG